MLSSKLNLVFFLSLALAAAAPHSTASAQTSGAPSAPTSSMPSASSSSDPRLIERGHTTYRGHDAEYLIRRLPISSFPDLPAEVAADLNHRACMIPQSYQAHRPENVIHGSFQKIGTSDWAALCSASGTTTLLVYFSGAGGRAIVLDSYSEQSILQTHDPSGVLGFSLGIDAASPERLHQAQTALNHRPPSPTHDAVALTLIDHSTDYHLFETGNWINYSFPE